MNLSQRLRTCAKHTGLDAVIELLNEAADEIERLSAKHPAEVTGLLEAFDDAVSQELLSVSHVEYDSHEICKHFASKVRTILALRHVQVPMTDEQVDHIWNSLPIADGFWLAFARAIEAHHGIKPKEQA